jgi:hypothetical protein
MVDDSNIRCLAHQSWLQNSDGEFHFAYQHLVPEGNKVVIKELMRKIVLALFIAVLPTLAAAQQTSRPSKPSKKVDTLHSASGNPCAKYGVGFAKVAGSDTCIKIGGSVGVEAGGSSRR